MSSYQTSITCERKDGVEVPVHITFEYQPFEPMTRDYPGCEAAIENIQYDGLTEWRDEIEEACWEHVRTLRADKIERDEMAAEARMEMLRESRYASN